MEKPQKNKRKFQAVNIPNPNYKKQLASYKEFLKREVEKVSRKLRNLRTQINKIDKELK